MGGELVVYYQPIYSLYDESVVTIEALLRWRARDGSLLGAPEALALPETADERFALDLAVLRQACTDLVLMLPEHGPAGLFTVNVNLTPSSLQVPDLDVRVLQVLAETGLAPGHLRFEVPETAALAELAVAAEGLRRITASGIALTLDDVGVDDVGLRYLKALTIDGIKVDRALTTTMLDSEADHSLVRLIADLCAGLEIRLTVEGIETHEQLELARTLGIRAVQGHHVSPPVPLEELRSLLRTGGGLCAQCFPRAVSTPA